MRIDRRGREWPYDWLQDLLKLISRRAYLLKRGGGGGLPKLIANCK